MNCQTTQEFHPSTIGRSYPSTHWSSYSTCRGPQKLWWDWNIISNQGNTIMLALPNLCGISYLGCEHSLSFFMIGLVAYYCTSCSGFCWISQPVWWVGCWSNHQRTVALHRETWDFRMCFYLRSAFFFILWMCLIALFSSSHFLSLSHFLMVFF